MTISPAFHQQADFHRRGFTDNRAWWIPLRELLFLLLGLILAILVAALVLMSGYFALTKLGWIEPVDVGSNMDSMTNPWGLTITLLSLAVFLPATWWAVRKGGKRPFGSVISSDSYFRRQLVTIALPSILAIHFLGYALLLFFGERGELTLDRNALILLVAVIALIPLQAAAEELIFRGFLPQVLGSWKCPAIVAYAIPSVLFMAGHTYNWIGLIDIIVFAGCASLLTHKLRGIEVPIAIHVVNNLLAMGLGAVGIFDLNDESVTVATTALGSAMSIAVTVMLLRNQRLREAAAVKNSLNHSQSLAV